MFHLCAHISLLCIDSLQHDTQESGNMDRSVKGSWVSEVARRFAPHCTYNLSTLDILVIN